MEVKDSVEAKLLGKLYEKFLTVADTAHAFRNNAKAMKVCLKLIKIEVKTINKSKVPIDPADRNGVLKLYKELHTIVKGIVKSKKIQDINRFCDDLDEMIFTVNIEITELQKIAASAETEEACGEGSPKKSSAAEEN